MAYKFLSGTTVSDQDWRTATEERKKSKKKQDFDEQRKRAEETQRKAQEKAKTTEKSQSLFSKIKKGAKEVAEGIRDTGYRSANTVAAGTGSVVGLNVAAAQAATGNTKAAKQTIKSTLKTSDDILDHGIGNKGGYLTSKQAKSSGGGAKSYKENFIKPTLKATSEVAPLVVPAGATAKGASLFAKIAHGAGQNVAVGAGSNAAAQYADKGKVDMKDVTKAGVEAGIIGGVFPAASAGVSKASKAVRKSDPTPAPNSIPQAVLDEYNAKVATQPTQPTQPVLPQPGEVIKPIAKDKALKESHGDYFNVKDKSPTVKVEDLKLTKPVEQNIASSLNAEVRMRKASEGGMDKRDPVLVRKTEDGKYDVLDGNATTTVAQKHGWKTLPVDTVTSKIPPQPHHVAAAREVIKTAHKENPEFQSTIGDIAKTIGATYNGGPVKSVGRTLTKIMDDYSGKPGRIKDTVRGTMELTDSSTAGFNKTIDAIKAKYPNIKIKDGYKNYKTGYADVKVTVTLPSGHKAEIILATPEMLKAKNELGGHELYEIARDMTRSEAERKAAADQMNLLYGQAHDAANKRLASSSDTPASSTKTLSASASEISSEPSRITPTSAETPVSTTVSRNKPEGKGRTESTTSSGDKNSVRESSIPSTVAEKSPIVKQNKTLTPVQTAHMPTIDGYTHSTHMETEYADMLRQTEAGLKGGQTIKNPDGTYRRTSEHSKFYRDYYKEFGRAPNKQAWLEEAQRQLSSGKAQYGASDGYKKLLEREGRPIPRMKVEPSTIEAKKQITPKVAKRIADDLKKDYGDLATIDKVNLKDQANKAAKLVADRELLDKVISGEAPLPDGLRATSVITALRPQFKTDPDLLLKVANSPLSAEASLAGQELRLARENAAFDAVHAIRNIKKTRTEAFERKSKTTAAKAVNNEVKAIRQAKPKVTKETFASFVDSLKC